MARTGRRDTKPELELRRRLHRQGFRFRVDRQVIREVRRRADVVFASARVAIFVDGCFWHGCANHATWPKRNADFWRDKIETNRSRDLDTDRRLAAAGWTVVRVWEHEDPDAAAQRIAALLRSRKAATAPSPDRQHG